jgi:hypothetical protein
MLHEHKLCSRSRKASFVSAYRVCTMDIANILRGYISVVYCIKDNVYD